MNLRKQEIIETKSVFIFFIFCIYIFIYLCFIGHLPYCNGYCYMCYELYRFFNKKKKGRQKTEKSKKKEMCNLYVIILYYDCKVKERDEGRRTQKKRNNGVEDRQERT